MWRQYFNIKGIKPGVIVYPRPFNEVDFRDDDLDPEKLLKIYEAGHPYLEITDAGINHFYPDKMQKALGNTMESIQEVTKNTESSYFTAKDLVAKIQEADNEADARYYYGLGKKYSTVQKAFDKKLEEFNQ